MCIIGVWYYSAYYIILELSNSKTKCTKLIYAFFHHIYILSLLKLELWLFSYEIKHFSMAFKQINANNKLNILNMDESSIL